MATYITLLKYTEQGLKTIKESPSRLEKAKQLLKSLGGELKSFHLVQGRYDAIVLSEAPNDEVGDRLPLGLPVRDQVRARHRLSGQRSNRDSARVHRGRVPQDRLRAAVSWNVESC